MPTRKWGGENLVNTTLSGYQFDSDVVGLTGGGFVVVWQDDSTADSTIQGQRYDALGNRVGGELTVLSAVGGDYVGPAVTALADGGFYVTSTLVISAENHSIVGSVHDANGAFVRSQSAFFFGLYNDSDVVRLGTGSVVVWTDSAASLGDIKFRIFDAAGNGGAIVNANNLTGDVQDKPAVAVSTDQSQFAVVWSDHSDSSIRARVFDVNGAEQGPEFQIDATDSLITGNPTIAWVSANRFVVSWYETYIFASQTVSTVRVFDDLGHAVSDPVHLGSFNLDSPNGPQQTPTITALVDGGFVVSWQEDGGSVADPDQAIMLQAFDREGNRIGGRFIVNTTTSGDQVQPSIVALVDGRVVVSWTDESSGTSDIRMQIVDPRDGVVTGTGAADTLYGHDLINDEITGFAGADTLYGLRGDDGLYGGQGADLIYGGIGNDLLYGGADGDSLLGDAGEDDLFGEDGNDILNGGASADLMQGGADNDTYFVDNAGDTVVEGAGQGTLDFVAAKVSYTLAAGVQVEKFTTTSSGGTTAINLTGNEAAQSISGNAGANIINGRAGLDKLTGAGGADAFVFDTAPGASNYDHIADFVHSQDKIRLDHDIFATLPIGALSSAAFKDISSAAEDANDRILYKHTNGAVYYDADGAGGAAPQLIAILDNHPAIITSADFLVIA